MATEAMKAGKHVISAVPAGMTVEELEQLLETVKSTGMKYMMAETSYYRPEIVTCREWSKAGKFGTIFYSEAEYYHEGLIALMFDDRGLPTWRHGLPPMHYPTHSVGMVVPVTGERLVEVQAVGWGDGHEVLRTNEYHNPFWNTTGFFKTSKGHSSRISVCWHIASGETERAQFYGDRLSYIMERPEHTPNTVISIGESGKTTLDSNGYPKGDLRIEKFDQPNYWDRLARIHAGQDRTRRLAHFPDARVHQFDCRRPDAGGERLGSDCIYDARHHRSSVGAAGAAKR